jgi:hypothetical protein
MVRTLPELARIVDLSDFSEYFLASEYPLAKEHYAVCR